MLRLCRSGTIRRGWLKQACFIGIVDVTCPKASWAVLWISSVHRLKHCSSRRVRCLTMPKCPLRGNQPYVALQFL
jgi:hypothetical protein